MISRSGLSDPSLASWAKNAPTPASLASTCTINYLEQPGKCNTGGEYNNF